ncbi:MAG TPA: flagellar motor protein MotB [Allosphingosinicella sp.]|nr:flagellar motor protein MotB [Allosphingosinicella sp.]
MASAAMKRGRNDPAPQPQPIIVKKIVAEAHGAHHGGAWKIAYADFVTAMMAFFLLLWLLGATDEDQRKGLADYFTPTLIEYKQNSAGSNGIMGGDSIVSADNYPHKAGQTGSRAITIPRDVTGGVNEGAVPRNLIDREEFRRLSAELRRRIEASPELRRLSNQVSFAESDEGLRIDLMDEANFSMFRVGTAELLPAAQRLVREVAQVIGGVPNPVIIRGHTDSLPYAAGRTTNNWTLSAARAEATRGTLEAAGIPLPRISRIEGVADRQPYLASDRYDPRNRRISITLGWRGGPSSTSTRPTTSPPPPAAAPPARQATH